MQIKQSNLFAKSYKKLHKQVLTEVNLNIKLIINDPESGDLKSGDLAHVRVLKFKVDAHLYLLAYQYDVAINLLYLLALGEHENFYNKLKNHIR